jgi:hypothetical protein
MMAAAGTSETLVNFYQTTRRYNPEDSHLYLIFDKVSERNVSRNLSTYKTIFDF